jgi:hypothetical protein
MSIKNHDRHARNDTPCHTETLLAPAAVDVVLIRGPSPAIRPRADRPPSREGRVHPRGFYTDSSRLRPSRRGSGGAIFEEIHRESFVRLGGVKPGQ